MGKIHCIQYSKLPLSIINYVYNSPGKIVNVKGYKIFSKDDRYLNFIVNGTKCAKCGLEGRYCKLESRGRGPHLNVYGIDEQGEEVILTKDHIYPKSKGGLNCINNYQVLCSKCNREKADNSPITLVQALNEGKATKYSVSNAVKRGRPKALVGV